MQCQWKCRITIIDSNERNLNSDSVFLYPVVFITKIGIYQTIMIGLKNSSIREKTSLTHKVWCVILPSIYEEVYWSCYEIIPMIYDYMYGVWYKIIINIFYYINFTDVRLTLLKENKLHRRSVAKK